MISRFSLLGDGHVRRGRVAAGHGGHGRARARATSRCICSTSASTVSKRRSPRRRARNVEPQLAAVEVAVEVEQVGLDEHAAAGHEGRAHADVDAPAASATRRPPRRRAAGVDAVARADERVRSGTRLAVGKPSSRPRSSPCCDLAAELERRAEEAVAPARRRRPTTRPRMWVEETISPSTSTSGDDARLERGLRRAAGRRRPCAWWPKRKFSPTDTCVAPSAPTRTSSMNSCGACAANERVERDHDQLAHAEPGDQVGLDARAASAASARRRARPPWRGCGSKVSTVSAPRITSRWPRCTPSNSPTATRRGRVLGVGEPGDRRISRGSLRRA